MALPFDKYRDIFNQNKYSGCFNIARRHILWEHGRNTLLLHMTHLLFACFDSSSTRGQSITRLLLTNHNPPHNELHAVFIKGITACKSAHVRTLHNQSEGSIGHNAHHLRTLPTTHTQHSTTRSLETKMPVKSCTVSNFTHHLLRINTSISFVKIISIMILFHS